MKFEWDASKNRTNIEKHGISFEEACKIFESLTLSSVDRRVDYGETRYISIGSLDAKRVIVVVHTLRNQQIRIISARFANRKERQRFHEKIQKAHDQDQNGTTAR